MHGVMYHNGRIEPWCHCPRCGDFAITESSIISAFGTRVPNGIRVPQSNCRRCRKEALNDPNLKEIIPDASERRDLVNSKNLFMTCSDTKQYEYICQNSIPNRYYNYKG